MTDLRKLMNHGFLVYEQDNRFILKKIPTPRNASCAVNNVVSADCSTDSFASYDEAIARAEELLTPTAMWDAQVMYKHCGFGAQIKALEDIQGATYEDAMLEARLMAETMFENDESVESWDVRVRPAQM